MTNTTSGTNRRLDHMVNTQTSPSLYTLAKSMKVTFKTLTLVPFGYYGLNFLIILEWFGVILVTNYFSQYFGAGVDGLLSGSPALLAHYVQQLDCATLPPMGTPRSD